MEEQYPMYMIRDPSWMDGELCLEWEEDKQEDIADFDRWMERGVLEEDTEYFIDTNIEPFFKYECTDKNRCISFRRNNFACRCVRKDFETAKHFAQYNAGIMRIVLQGITGV